MVNLIGEKFGRLTVVEFDRLQNHKAYWKCVCDCGLVVIASGNNLRSGNTSSCGCLRRETTKARGLGNAKHNESHQNKTRLYTIWCGMRQRCSNPNKKYYNHYGGKGVRICDEWNNYSVFKEWALANGYADNLSIDRIDNNGNYEPSNCRWTTYLEQNNNRRSNVYLTYQGETKTMTQWARDKGIKPGTLCRRLKVGWTVEEALGKST